MNKNFDVLKTLKHWREVNTEKGVTWIPTFVVEAAEQALQKAQEPKKYLTWEELEFKEENQTMKVLLNGTEYMLSYFTDGIYKYIDLLTDNMRYPIGRYVDCYSYEKNFFNDLRLERVKENE